MQHRSRGLCVVSTRPRARQGAPPVSVSEYPKLAEVNCAICGAKITLIIELIIGTPEPIDGLMRLPLDPEPTVLSGCHHFYDVEINNG